MSSCLYIDNNIPSVLEKSPKMFDVFNKLNSEPNSLYFRKS